MLYIARSMKELPFELLMHIYMEANREHGAELAPMETEADQIRRSEDDFYDYLREQFFPVKGAFYALWSEAGAYVSALRIEPYADGLLLEALETAPEERRKGYGALLVQSVQQLLSQQGAVRLYSHVSKKNVPSLNLHLQCGFTVYRDSAAYIDGSVNARAYTLLWEKKN